MNIEHLQRLKDKNNKKPKIHQASINIQRQNTNLTLIHDDNSILHIARAIIRSGIQHMEINIQYNTRNIELHTSVIDKIKKIKSSKAHNTK